jgi:hypothetical protein
VVHITPYQNTYYIAIMADSKGSPYNMP